MELRELARTNASSGRVHVHLARRLEADGRLREAMDAYWNALQRNEDDNEAWQGWARTTQANLGPDKARQVAELWIKRDPSSAGAWSALARSHQLNGDHQRAYDAAAKATTLDPQNGAMWQLMGMEASALVRPEEAEKALRSAIACSPNDWRNHAGLGEALSFQRRSAEAIACFREAIRVSPNISSPHLLLGSELLKSAQAGQELEAARLEIQRGMDLAGTKEGPWKSQSRLLMGDLYKKQQKWKEALEWYGQAEALNPNDATIQYNLIRVYRGLGDTRGAERAAARHRELDNYNHRIAVLLDRAHVSPDDVEPRIQLARLYVSHGEISRAISAYQVALSKQPNAPGIREELQKLQSLHSPSGTP